MSVLLGFLFAGYLVMAGLDYGVAISASRKGDLDRLSPFFLGNEVWLVAAIGLLLGAFPLVEAQLLGEQRTPIAIALIGVVLVTAAYGLRIFSRSAQWDTAARLGGVLAGVGWGAAIGGIIQGGRFHVTFLVIACAVALPALLAAHGWAFLRRRWPVLGLTSAGLAGAVLLAGSKVDLVPAGDATLSVVAPVAYAVIPLLILLQAATWWIFRDLPAVTPARAEQRAADRL